MIEAQIIGVDAVVILRPALVLTLIPYDASYLHAGKRGYLQIVLRAGLLEIPFAARVPFFGVGKCADSTACLRHRGIGLDLVARKPSGDRSPAP